MMSGKNVAVALMVVSWVWCLVVARSHPEGDTRRISSGFVDLAHPIDDPLALDLPVADGDHKEHSAVKSDISNFPGKTVVRESDFEREKRREMEVAKEKDLERDARRREQINMAKEAIHSSSTSEMDRQREDGRQREVVREIMKAEESKREILQRKSSVPVQARERNRFISIYDNTSSNRGGPISLQRQIDRALRGGNVVEMKGKPQRETLHDDGHGGWSQSSRKTDHVQNDESRRKAPILILEQVPVRYPESTESTYSSQTHSEESRGVGYSDNEGWPGSDHRLVDSSRETTLVDPRSPDRPVILPRPSTTNVDRRPDRPDYPYKYGEIHISVLDDSAKHHEDLLDILPIDQSFPTAATEPRRSLVPHAPYGLPHSVEGLSTAAHADAANAHLALEQALIAEHTLRAQAIQAGKIKQAAVAAHLVSQAAAHRLAAQQLAAQKAATQQFAAQEAAVQQFAAQKAAVQQLAAQKAAIQRIAARTAASKLKAAQLGHIAAGNEAIKDAIKTNLESDITHRLKKLIPQDSLARVVSGAGVEVQTGGATVLAAPFTPNLQHHLIAGSQQIQQMRKELLHRLSLLKPYFETSTAGFAVPSIIPDLPRGEHLTSHQVEALPKIVLQIPNGVVQPVPLHIGDLEEELHPPLNFEFLEYLMGLPDDLFLIVTNLSKPQFLAMLFPRLYRSSVQPPPPLTNTSVLAHTSVYSISTTTPSSSYVTTELHPHHKSQYTHPSYETLPLNPAYHTTLRPSSVAHSFTTSPLFPATTASSAHKISIGTLSRSRPVTTSYVSQEPPITYSTSLPVPHTPTTLFPPSLSSLGYGKPKPSSVIELSDLPNKYGDKGHHNLKHIPENVKKNLQEYHHSHDHDSREDSNGGHKKVFHHHVHHHLHSAVSTSASPSATTVKDPSHTRFQSDERSDYQNTHEHFHLLVPKDQVHRDMGKSFHVTEGTLLASTTPRISASSFVSGVGLRPHGSNLMFSTPTFPPSHVPLSSPVTPLHPATIETTALTSSYTSYLPSSSDTSYISTSPTTNCCSFLGVSSPSTTYVSPQSHKTATKLSSFTTIHPFVLITTTARPEVPFSSTHNSLPPSEPFTPATSPVFTVTQIPSTPDSSTVFRLESNITLNGQFLPVVSDGLSHTKLLLHDSGRKETEVRIGNAFDPLIEKLRSASEEGSNYDRVPGTEFSDDDHILSPFNKRKGNGTHAPQQTNNDSNGEFPEKGKSVTISQTTASSDGWRPLIKPIQDLQRNSSAVLLASVVSPQDDLETQKKHPVPQLVGADGLPLAPPQGLHHAYPVISPGKTLSATHGPLPLSAEDIAELPSYLREAPPCASVPTEKSFCLMPHGYPSELASSLVERYNEELTEIWRILSQHTHHAPPPNSQGLLTTGVDTSMKCDVEEKTVKLSWSRDVLGSWFVILQTAPYTQTTSVTTCSAAARVKGCRPLLRPRPLLALQPQDPEPRPFVLEFPLPVACVLPDPRLRAHTFPASGTLTADLPLTPPTANHKRDDKFSDVVIHDPDNFMVLLSGKSKLYTTVTSPNTKKRTTPLSLTLPPTPRIISISVTSQATQRIPLTLRPDSQRKGAGDDTEVFLICDKVQAEVRLKSRGTPLRLTYSVLASSLTVSLIIQR